MAPLPQISASEVAPLSAVQVANTFISRFGKEGRIDHLKLQKLVYYSYGWWLALKSEKPALINVKPQVWKLGPVFQPVYGAFAAYRDQFITEKKPIGPFSPPVELPRTDAPESGLIDWIWSRYGHYNGFELSDMTHQPDTPWFNIAREHKFVVPRFLEMEDDKNRAYFTELAAKEGYFN